MVELSSVNCGNVVVLFQRECKVGRLHLPKIVLRNVFLWNDWHLSPTTPLSSSTKRPPPTPSQRQPPPHNSTHGPDRRDPPITLSIALARSRYADLRFLSSPAGRGRRADAAAEKKKVHRSSHNARTAPPELIRSSGLLPPLSPPDIWRSSPLPLFSIPLAVGMPFGHYVL